MVSAQRQDSRLKLTFPSPSPRPSFRLLTNVLVNLLKGRVELLELQHDGLLDQGKGLAVLALLLQQPGRGVCELVLLAELEAFIDAQLVVRLQVAVHHRRLALKGWRGEKR